jgi:BMFP domain-containing protein YqiC
VQEKAPAAKSKLEEMLAKALKDNPDIRVATAKLGEAEAELNRVRLRVMQKVVTLYHTIEMARADVATAERALARMKQLSNNKVVSREEVDAAEAALAAAKAKLAAVEAEVPYVIGKQPQMADAEAATLRGLMFLRAMQAAGAGTEGHIVFPPEKAGTGAAPRPVQGPVADRLRQALDQPVSLRVTEGGVADVLDLLRKKEPGLNVKFVPGPGAPQKLTFELKDLPLGAALEYLEDSLPHHGIVVREYGLLLTPTDRVPPGAVSLHDFWKHGRGEAAAKSPPAKDVEGVIKQVNTTGLLTISVGSDAGLVKGNTLEVFRTTGPAPKYFGTVQVIDTRPTEAVCRPVGRLAGVPQPGDRVASRVKEK